MEKIEKLEATIYLYCLMSPLAKEIGKAFPIGDPATNETYFLIP
jgi:hypothetical protein